MGREWSDHHRSAALGDSQNQVCCCIQMPLTENKNQKGHPNDPKALGRMSSYTGRISQCLTLGVILRWQFAVDAAGAWQVRFWVDTRVPTRVSLTMRRVSTSRPFSVVKSWRYPHKTQLFPRPGIPRRAISEVKQLAPHRLGGFSGCKRCWRASIAFQAALTPQRWEKGLVWPFWFRSEKRTGSRLRRKIWDGFVVRNALT